jgi:hypothetical protein
MVDRIAFSSWLSLVATYPAFYAFRDWSPVSRLTPPGLN